MCKFNKIKKKESEKQNSYEQVLSAKPAGQLKVTVLNYSLADVNVEEKSKIMEYSVKGKRRTPNGKIFNYFLAGM